MWLVVVGLLLPFSPLGGSQTPAPGIGQADNTVVVADASQDVFIYAAPRLGGPSQNASAQGNQFDHLDILKIVVGDESVDDFKVSLFLKAINPAQATTGYGRQVFFALDGLDWRLTVGACNRGFGQGASQTEGCLAFRDEARGFFRAHKTVPLAADTSANALRWTIPKKEIFNPDRVTARFGMQIVNITANAQQNIAFTNLFFLGDPAGGVVARDWAPNSGVGGPFTFVQGSNGKGHLGMTSDDPLRVSNGEATTIVYHAEVFNHHSEALRVELSGMEVPDGWSVRVPSLIKVEGGRSVAFPVILSLPFTHNHGQTATFKVHAQAVEDPGSMAHLELGVYWTEVPQPSAHHNGRQWFHSAPAEGNPFPEPVGSTAAPFMEAWMNGIEKDPDPSATDANVPSFFNEGVFEALFDPAGGPPKHVASWFFPLSPELLLGLDFDTTQPALFSFDLTSDLPQTPARVSASLLYCNPAAQATGDFSCPNGAMEVVASGMVSDTMAATKHFDLPLAVKPEYDFIPYRTGANLALYLELETDTPQNVFLTEPRPEFVTDKATLDLPLFEYHDPVDQAFERVGSLELVNKSPVEKQVNPGRTTVFFVDVANHADAVQRVRFEFDGINKEWARIVGEPEVDLQPHETRNVSLAVTVPEGTQADTRIELFFVAQDLADPAVVAVSRLRAVVVASPDIPDESGLAQAAPPKNDTPGPGLVVAVALVGLVAFTVGRRRLR